MTDPSATIKTCELCGTRWEGSDAIKLSKCPLCFDSETNATLREAGRETWSEHIQRAKPR